MPKTVLILGGYGNTGIRIARLLLQETDVHLVLAGRNIQRATQAADALNHGLATPRVAGIAADAGAPDSLRVAFAGIDIVVVASSTLDHVQTVAQAALQAGVDYLDIQLSSPAKQSVLQGMEDDITKAGRCFITDGGYHPGVPAAMVRYAATRLDDLTTANVSAAFQLNWGTLSFSAETSTEFLDELQHFNPTVLQNGQWKKQRLWRLPQFDFGEPFGKKAGTPMWLEELHALPAALPTLNEMGFYIAGFNGMTDYVIMPFCLFALSLFGDKARGPIDTVFSWSLKTFSRPPYGAVLQLEAVGSKAGRPCSLHMRLTDADAYVLTAVPVVACLLQYLQGVADKPGLWFQAHAVDPVEFFQDMERMGIGVDIRYSSTQTAIAV